MDRLCKEQKMPVFVSCYTAGADLDIKLVLWYVCLALFMISVARKKLR